MGRIYAKSIVSRWRGEFHGAIKKLYLQVNPPEEDPVLQTNERPGLFQTRGTGRFYFQKPASREL